MTGNGLERFVEVDRPRATSEEAAGVTVPRGADSFEVMRSVLPPAPLPRTYWVTPSLLAGVYPGAAKPGEAERKVRALRDAGVTLFIDLTDRDDRLEPYEQLLGESARRVAVPVPDLTDPSPADVVAAIEMIDAEASAGGISYVHCWGGIGRTGSIIGCWLAERMGGAAALQRLADLRADYADALRRSPETAAQCRLVEGWGRRGARPVTDPLAGGEWEVLRWMEIDAATCMLGDADAFSGEVPLGRGEGEIIGRLTACVLPGRALAAMNTGGDQDVPVEVLRDAGEIVAARLCLVNDVDEAPGVWKLLGELAMESGTAVAADPFCVPSDLYHLTFDVRVGTYVAEVFVAAEDQDALALRIRLQ